MYLEYKAEVLRKRKQIEKRKEEQSELLYGKKGKRTKKRNYNKLDEMDATGFDEIFD